MTQIECRVLTLCTLTDRQTDPITIPSGDGGNYVLPWDKTYLSAIQLLNQCPFSFIFNDIRLYL